MENIVPGGHYFYKAATKQIFLSYEYYKICVENIHRIKNLSKNLDFYNSDNPKYPLVFENGCITHSYPASGEDGDKIQIVLRTPITGSLTELTAVDGVITLETDGKILVLPTDNSAVLPSFNEYVLNPNRLTIVESPFGGLKSGSPDYCPGTLFVNSGDGVYLTDAAGNNSTKTLTAGMLKGVGGLTVDTSLHTVTQDFQIVNTGDNNPTVIDACDSAPNGWIQNTGPVTITSTGGKIIVSGTTTAGDGFCNIKKTIGTTLNGKQFISFEINSGVSCTLSFALNSGNSASWSNRLFPISANTITRFVLPILAPAGTTGLNPASNSGFNPGLETTIYIGIKTTENTAVTYSIDNITADTGKQAYIELQTPDNLAASSLTTQCWTGTSWETVRTDYLDGAYSNVSIDTTKAKFLDGTLLDHVYGTGLGRAVFPKGISGAEVTGSTGTMTYSANQGTSQRIGLMVSLPPSDGGRTNFNKIRLRTILRYTDTVGNVVPDLSGNGNTGTIIGGVTKLNDGGLKFDGSTGYVRIPKPSGFDASTALTVYTKIKANPQSDKYIISHWDSGAGQRSWGIRSSAVGSTNQFEVLISSDGTYSASTTKIYRADPIVFNNATHDIGFTWDNGTLKLYIDCSECAVTKVQDPSFSSLHNSTANLAIGANYNSGNGNAFYTGDVIEAYTATRALSGSEMLALHNNQSVSSTGLVLNYKPTTQNMGSTSHEFADSTNASYGLQNITKSWCALYSPESSIIDIYHWTHRPQALSFKRNEAGVIHELSLYPGTGSIYHGQIPFADPTLDTDSNLIPDCLESSIAGSVTKFLENYSMVIP